VLNCHKLRLCAEKTICVLVVVLNKLYLKSVSTPTNLETAFNLACRRQIDLLFFRKKIELYYLR